MPTYSIPSSLPEFTVDTPHNYEQHSIAIDPQGCTGTLVIMARYPGDKVFRTVPNGVVDLSNPVPFGFDGPVDVWRFQLFDVEGLNPIIVTETSSSTTSGVAYGEFRSNTSDGLPIYIPRLADRVSVGLYPNGGTPVVEYTISSRRSIREGTAIWLPWAAGAVSEPTVDTLLANVTAIRATEGATLEVVSS